MQYGLKWSKWFELVHIGLKLFKLVQIVKTGPKWATNCPKKSKIVYCVNDLKWSTIVIMVQKAPLWSNLAQNSPTWSKIVPNPVTPGGGGREYLPPFLVSTVTFFWLTFLTHNQPWKLLYWFIKIWEIWREKKMIFNHI